MMPGLVHNISAASSTSRAADRGAFPKPFNELRLYADEASAGGASINLPQAVRAFHPPVAAQAMRVQSCLNPAAELVSKAEAACVDWRVSTQRTMSECGSSGSTHEPSSVCLAAMVNEFMEEDCVCGKGSCTPACRSGSCDSLEEAMSKGVADISKSLQSLTDCQDDREVKLLRNVQAIVESITGSADGSWHPCTEEMRKTPAHNCRKRVVMTRLQRIGYDTAICKTRWDHAGGIPGGDYEYIDVLFPCNSPAEPLRLIVDIDFQAQFEIARPSREFSAAVRLLSPIFVGRPERLQQIVHLMAEATKHSLREKGLHLPPWRKLSYMKAKWFSLYKRTSNDVACRDARTQVGDFANGRDFTGIAIRGCGLDTRCTNELELYYYGANLLARASKDDAPLFVNDRDKLITVSTTDWQPPPVEVRSLSNSRKQRKVTGLASMLRRPMCNEIVAKAA